VKQSEMNAKHDLFTSKYFKKDEAPIEW
jgi:hypothetical protein